MGRLDPKKKAPAWKSKTWHERVCEAALLLSTHGFISMAESDKVYKRIRKWKWKSCGKPTA